MSAEQPTISSSQSPEWANLTRVLGTELLARLLGISPSRLRRYVAGRQATPEQVVVRLQVIAGVVGDLAGSYDDTGVRRWFQRPRIQLGGQSPATVLQSARSPHDEGPVQVQRLAASLPVAR